MKKVLAVMFAVLFALSSICAISYAADATAEANDTTVEVSTNFPDTINVNYSTAMTCPYCGKVCADSQAYADHLEVCEDAKTFAGNAGAILLKCYYCSATFKSEAAYNAHCAVYVNCKDHIASCPYSGADYLDLDEDGVPGCPCTFNTKDQYAAHTEICPYKGQYSAQGYLNLLKGLLKDFFVGIFKNADWSSVLGGLKGLVAGFDLGALKEIFNAVMGAAGIDFSI